MNMPKISPLPTKIKEKSNFKKFTTWLTFRRQWCLLEDWSYVLQDDNVKIVIPKGFIFDGVSMPKILHWFLSPTGILFIPGLVHDFAYRNDYLWAINDGGELYQYKKDSGRHVWDKMFKEVGLSLNGMKGLNAFARIVLLFCGGRSWKKNRNLEDLVLKPSCQ